MIIAVANTGQGIDSRVLPRVFERSRQGDRKIAHGDGALGLGDRGSTCIVTSS